MCERNLKSDEDNTSVATTGLAWYIMRELLGVAGYRMAPNVADTEETFYITAIGHP